MRGEEVGELRVEEFSELRRNGVVRNKGRGRRESEEVSTEVAKIRRGKSKEIEVKVETEGKRGESKERS